MATKPTSTLGWLATTFGVEEPDTTSKTDGFAVDDRVPAQWINWVWKLASQWWAYVDEIEGTTLSWSAVQNFLSQVTFGGSLVSSLALAITARLRTHIRTTGRTLIWESTSISSPLRAARIYAADVSVASIALELTLNAWWGSDSLWHKDVTNGSSLVLKLRVPIAGSALNGSLTAARKAATQNTAWADTFGGALGTGWDGGVMTWSPATDTTANAVEPRWKFDLYGTTTTDKTLVAEFGIASQRVRIWGTPGGASQSPRLEITVNAAWDNADDEWSKDVSGQRAYLLRLDGTALTLAGKEPAQNAAWGDSVVANDATKWDAPAAIISAAAKATLSRGLSLGGDLLSDADAIISRIRIIDYHPSDSSDIKTLWLDKDFLPGVRVYSTANGRLELVTNAKWDNGTTKWSKDTPGKRAMILRLGPDDASGDYFQVAVKHSTQDTAWSDGVNNSTHWSRQIFGSKVALPIRANMLNTAGGITADPPSGSRVGCSVDRDTGTNEVRIIFGSALPNNDYCAFISASGDAPGGRLTLVAYDFNKSTTEFRFKLAFADNTVCDLDARQVEIDVLIVADATE